MLLLALGTSPAATEEAASPAVFAGQVLVQNNGPRTMMVFFQRRNAPITRVLRLASETPFPITTLTFDRATVSVEGGQAVITDADAPRSLVLALDGTDIPEFPDDFEVTVLRGYGLTSKRITDRRTIRDVTRAPRVAAEDFWCDASFYSCDDIGGTDGGYGAGGRNYPSCDAGGAGATSCSCTGGGQTCSISCGSGYFACCRECYSFGRTPECLCVKL